MMLYKKLSRKKHVRGDGWLVELVSKIYDDEPFDCIHSYLVSIEPMASRAGHYHNKKEEWFCITSGRIELVIEDIDTKASERTMLDSGSSSYEMIYIPPGTAHLLKNPSDKERASLIVFSKELEDANDTIPYELR
jgi:dTDP-4-dehydrorhamnose 3,5-epimerase-like enzyme